MTKTKKSAAREVYEIRDVRVDGRVITVHSTTRIVEPTAEVRRMAAVSRMTPMGSRDSKGRLLPLRYRAAEQQVREYEAATTKGA